MNLLAQSNKVSFHGYNNCIRLHNQFAEVIISSESGGRVLAYRIANGKNLIFLNSKFEGKLLDNYQKEGFDPDGGRFDYTPESETRKAHDVTWFGKYDIVDTSDSLVTIRSQNDKELGLVTERRFLLHPGSSKLSVRQTWKNISKESKSYAYWSRTLVNSGGILLIPMSEHSRFPFGWGRYIWGTSTQFVHDPEDDGIRTENDLLVFDAEKSKNQKYGLDADEGLMVYQLNEMLFVKRYEIFHDLPYVKEDFGLNSIFFVERGYFIELEPIGPKITLKPGEETEFTEVWWILNYKMKEKEGISPTEIMEYARTHTDDEKSVNLKD